MKTLFKPMLMVGICASICFNCQAQVKSNQKNSKTQEVSMTGVHTEQENKALVRKLYEAAFNTGNFDQLKDLISEEYIGANGQKGAVQLTEQIRALRTGFPDIKWTIEEMVAEGDKVVVRSSWKGTHTGPFRNYAITKKAITNTALAMYQLKDGRIISVTLETDRLGFLQAIDVVPDNIVPQPAQRN